MNRDSSAPSCWEGVAVGKGDMTRPCFDSVALGKRRDVPHSLLLHASLRENSNNSFIHEEEPASLSSIKSDSCLSSLEYWDYTLELECMKDSQGN